MTEQDVLDQLKKNLNCNKAYGIEGIAKNIKNVVYLQLWSD